MRHALSLLLSCLLWHCADTRGPRADWKVSREPGVALSRVRYVVTVRPPPSSFQTDRGYTVMLERAYVGYANVGLAKCAPLPPSAGARLWPELLGMPVAHAGHEGVLDHSYAGEGWVLDLLRGPESQLLAERYFPRTRYCRAQTVVARADESFRGYPTGVALSGYTLHLRGTYARQRAEAPVPFVLETDLAYGQVRELSVGTSHVSDASKATLTFAHDVTRAFAGVDLGGDLELASKQALRNLIDATPLTVSFGEEENH